MAYWRHLTAQGKNLSTLARVGLSAALPARRKALTDDDLPGPEVAATVRPPSRRLVADYVRWCGGDPRSYEGTIPAHLFPHWGFPLLAQTLKAAPWPMARVLNQGCQITVNAPLPAGKPLRLLARLEGVRQDERKVRIHQRLVTGTDELPDALVTDVYAVVPLRKKGGEKPSGDAPKRERPRVPAEATEFGSRGMGPRAGLQFALLTGDFNPVHWIGPYARLAGFERTILHGFASLGAATEALIQSRWSGDAGRLARLDVRFTRPLLLPGTPRFFLYDHGEGDGTKGLAVGESPDGPAYMLGRFATRAR